MFEDDKGPNGRIGKTKKNTLFSADVLRFRKIVTPPNRQKKKRRPMIIIIITTTNAAQDRIL